MNVGVCRIDLELPGSRSLKDKRRAVRSIVDRVRSRFNVAIAEVDRNDSWQARDSGHHVRQQRRRPRERNAVQGGSLHRGVPRGRGDGGLLSGACDGTVTREPGSSSAVQLEQRQERLLRNLHVAHALHPLLALRLLLQQLPLARHVAAVALGQHVLA